MKKLVPKINELLSFIPEEFFRVVHDKLLTVWDFKTTYDQVYEIFKSLTFWLRRTIILNFLMIPVLAYNKK